jgi:hypothetical protein
MNIEQRMEVLKAAAAKQPLTWNPKKGEYLVGVLKAYGNDGQNCRHCLLEDDKKVLHRVAMNSQRQAELYKKQAQIGDIISIQFVGKERGYSGGTVEVFNIVVDKAEVL